MNKTINVNLGGISFCIDEDAYHKLLHYFEAIKRSLSNPIGKEEIMKDIELRVSELLLEKQLSDKHVVGLKEVDEVISIMGQPQDFVLDEDTNAKSFYNNYQTNKKLYRDKEKGLIGGVAAGLGHYFGVDSVWIRVILTLLVLAGFGSGILVYIVFWIATPKAETISEKLEMTGEPVNISNIEKKIREQFEFVSGKIKNVDYDKYSTKIKSEGGKVGYVLSEIIKNILKLFVKIFGGLLLFISLTALSTIVIAFIALLTVMSFPPYMTIFIFKGFPVWISAFLLLLTVGIPFFILSIVGMSLLELNTKPIQKTAKYVLLAIWILSISGIIILFQISK